VHLRSIIGYGTERYPEKIARRLRAVNLASCCTAVFCFGYGVFFALLPVWKGAIANFVPALVIAAVPLLHRFGSLAAPFGYCISVYVAIFVVCSMFGTATGMQNQYLALAAGSVLFFGIERSYISYALGLLGASLVVALELLVPRHTGLVSPTILFGSFIGTVTGTSAILFIVVLYALREVARAEAAAEREHARSESLLANILPAKIVERLKGAAASLIADRYDEASILFADMAAFTKRTSDTAPDDLVRYLNRVFTDFDRLVESHGLEKIKTTGDAYMVVSGVPVARSDHAQALARLALDMRAAAAQLHDPDGRTAPIRIGIASGPVVAGVVGTRKFFYDVWGDAVNVASRMQSTGTPGEIQVSQNAYERLKDDFVLEERGSIEVKGKGQMLTWFLVAPQARAHEPHHRDRRQPAETAERQPRTTQHIWIDADSSRRHAPADLRQSSYAARHQADKAARRRRALNIAALIGAALMGGVAIAELLAPTPGLWKVALANGLTAVALAAVPLLHRVGPLAAPIAFITTVYAATFVICLLLGTSTGMQFSYMVATAFAVLFFGAQRIWLAVAFGILAAALAIGLEVFVPRDTGLQPAAAVFGSFIVVVFASCVLLLTILFYALYEADRAEAVAEREHVRSESLLANILPVTIADRLKRGTDSVIADKYEEASILFADMAGFTARTSDTTPKDLVEFLNRVFSAFDELVENRSLEKIKTTGDAYMVVSGVPNRRRDHAQALAQLALDMRDAATGLLDPYGRPVPVRIGIASGPVVAGVVGTRKFFYDVWGDAVNIALRMEATGTAGKIQVSPKTYGHLKDHFLLEKRDPNEVPENHQMETWFLTGCQGTRRIATTAA
jgi:adenylate cyclase